MQLGSLIAGRYRLDESLAAGGMGEVWRGTDTRLNRVVAVKLLHSGLAGNDRFRARFHQEAQAVAALQSPGIVALYDYGEEHGPDGLVSYLIMELVRGQSLAALIHQRGRLAPSEVLKIVATASEALEVAHRAHIIHRDIKPANLLVGDDGSVKIVDFGIASARGQAGLTETGTVMGTLAYASPEQLNGSELTGATDLYSLGIVAYECLAGRPPFGGNEPASVITAHMTGQAAPLPPDVPAPVAQIVQRCLAKDPRQRYASAGELARACREGRPGAGTTAILPPASPPTRSTMPLGQGMAPGVAPAHTTVQPRTEAMGPDDFDSGPQGRPLPPPREPEEPKRNPTGAILATALGAIILVVALLILEPWNGNGGPTAGDGSTPDTSAEESADEPTEEGDDGGNDDSGQEQDQAGNDTDDSDTEEDTGSEETTEPAEDEAPPTATIEDYEGWDLNEALADLKADGFTNVSTYPVEEIGIFQECQVAEQNPGGGSQVSPDAEVQIGYVPDAENCGRS